MIGIRFAAPDTDWSQYKDHLPAALKRKGLSAQVAPDLAPELTDYIVYAPHDGLNDFSAFPRLKAVLSLWAGVERIVSNPTLQVPLTRMVDHGLRQGMIEWVLGHVLRHHLGMDAHIVNPHKHWIPVSPPLASERRVCVLGLGALGKAVAQALCTTGFDVTGWSRRPKQIEGLTCLSGQDGLAQALASAQILVLLLPDTPQTHNTLNRETLARLPKGAVIVNPGRGPLIDDDALLQALETGHIAHATLDVFRTEPLPQDHPFWTSENVTITPHIAAETRPQTASAVIAENIRRGEASEPFLHLVNRATGY